MKYELAKELKDAGFPQDLWSFSNGLFTLAYCAEEDCCNNELHLLHNDNDEGGNVGNDYQHREDDNISWIKVPSLSELIEACGKDFMLTNECGNWEAWGGSRSSLVRMGESGAEHECEGDTATEAVAHLWLALNKKP